MQVQFALQYQIYTNTSKKTVFTFFDQNLKIGKIGTSPVSPFSKQKKMIQIFITVAGLKSKTIPNE